MAEITLLPYSPEMRSLWDGFVSGSKNGTLLHRRDYMEYHADRFPDASLVAFRAGKPYALLPATFDGHTFSSHAGLTYGGLITDRKATVAEVMKVMEMVRDHARSIGANTFIYKPVPSIYHRLPADEDLYALFRMNAAVIARNVSSVISTASPLRLRDDRKAGMRKALREGITVMESDDFPAFWQILSDNLKSRYGASPVHTLGEMLRLKKLFPKEIRLFAAYIDSSLMSDADAKAISGDSEGKALSGDTQAKTVSGDADAKAISSETESKVMLGGTVIYLSPTVAHTQYISATPEGKRLHALDLLLPTLSSETFASLPWFDFGTSNEASGRILNENLISQKEGFGGRAIVYDTYSIPLST